MKKNKRDRKVTGKVQEEGEAEVKWRDRYFFVFFHKQTENLFPFFVERNKTHLNTLTQLVDASVGQRVRTRVSSVPSQYERLSSLLTTR